AESLVFGFIQNMRRHLQLSFLPVLCRPIGVGSTFEGWNPCEDDSIYCFLVPLKAPRGHTFHIEPGTAGETTARNFCIRVGLLCTCTAERWAKMRCFLHHPEDELKETEAPSLLHTLCTNSFLDVEKIAHWFSQNVKAVWKALPQSSQCGLTVLPSSRSCKFRVTGGRERSLTIEMIFGVQQGNSDVYLSSQALEATLTPSTMWPESYAVAEVKLFRHMTRQAPKNLVHLRCLRTCAHILGSTNFSTYSLKTVVMHLLTTTSLSSHHGTFYIRHVLTIMHYLRGCLEEKRLNHFFFGNKNVPKEIILPPDLLTAEPVNLFQHLPHNPDAHAKAWSDFNLL
ncbi:IPIL1 protein, partial [Centropus bengalensis]|nr:IPIL1 protein [Centropus bengalensis]